MKFKYDFVSVGSGVAGINAAIYAVRNGLKTAVIDHKAYGGACPNFGSDPKKILVGAAELYDWFTRMKKQGVVDGEIQINWPNLISYKNCYSDFTSGKIETSLYNNFIDTFKNTATFLNENTLRVGDDTIESKFILIATGSRPAEIPIEGRELMITSDDFLCLNSLPEEIVFVGGGYISLEFAQAAVRAGVKCTVIHTGNNILESFEPELIEMLKNYTIESGIHILFNSRVKSIKRKDSKLCVLIDSYGNQSELFADIVMHGAGRSPNMKFLDLENGGIEYSSKGVTVNKYLQSVSNKFVYAAGDVSDTPGAYLATTASMEGRIAAFNMLNFNKIVPEYKDIPTVVFTIPSLSQVGLTECEAKNRGLDVDIKFEDTSNWFTSYRVAEKYSGYKILTEKKSNKILGVHLLGRNCEDIINIFHIAIKTGMTTEQLKNFVYTYPTASSDITFML